MHSSALCADGEVRLVEGESEWEGRLEVCLSQRWGTVSSGGWSHTNTHVICNDLGYETINGKNDIVYCSIYNDACASCLAPDVYNVHLGPTS